MNELEKWWAGSWGDAYQARNVGRVEANVAFFRKALRMATGIDSVIELGAGMGENLLALRQMFDFVSLQAVEINDTAYARLRVLGFTAWHGSILEPGTYPENAPKAALAMTKGVLIHIAPADLPKAYAALYNASRRYILIAEYYNRTPVEVIYRGHEGKLFKRDFAGEMMDAYPNLKLVDCGFAWHREEQPQDDVTWFLMEKGI